MRERHSAVCPHDAHGAVGGHEARAGGDGAACRQRRVHLRRHGAHDAGRAGRDAARGRGRALLTPSSLYTYDASL